MIAFNLDGVSVTYVNSPIFKNLSWEIHDDRVVGLVGPNGCGKSTLLKLIVGELSSDTGFTVRKKGLTIGYLAQEITLTSGRSVWQDAMGASLDLREIILTLDEVEARLGDPAVYNDQKQLARALAQQTRLLDEFDRLGGPGYEGRVRSTLHALGFSDADLSLPLETLSGGQIKLVGLAKLIITQPDLLLLDEPDNHLDLESKLFLERLIRDYPGGVVIVSHDRYLLDMVVDEVVELEDGRLTQYPGNYSEYAFEKKARLLRQQQSFQAQQKEIHRLEQSAARLMLWGRLYDNKKFIRRGQSMMKRIEKIDRIDRPVLERPRMGLELDGWVGSSKVLEIRDLAKVFHNSPGESGLVETILFSGLNLLIHRGERVGLVGPNGAGKSLLFRIILGEEYASQGEVIIGPSVKTGYYAQQHETLENSSTLIDLVSKAMNRSEEHAVAFLGRFLFSYLQGRELVRDLSGGERSRLQMALLMLSGANFLLLDEPTNHLDIPSAEVLEEAIENFEGTVLVISHDRYFLDRVVSRIVELDEGHLTEYAGNYSSYRAQK